MRILLVAASASTTGGGEKHVADVAERLVARGVEVGLVCPPTGDLAELGERLGITIHPVDLSSGMRSAQITAVRRAIASAAPDLVHAHGSRAAFFARLADPRASSRVVYTVHGIHIDKAGSRARQVAFLAMERMLRRRTVRFIAVCASDTEKGARLGIMDPTRTSVVHNGIELPQAAPGGAFRAELGLDDEPLVLSVGRFHEQKDQRTLLAAWSRVVDAHPDAVLALIGSGEYDDALRAQHQALGLGDAMRFVDPRPGLGSAYADADVFALSSRWEGFPYVVIEAMAYGLPVVSTAVDGIPEAVEAGSTGLLVDAADPEGLAVALGRVLQNPDSATMMGAAGRRRVEESFTLDAMMDRLMDVYQETLEV